MITLDCWLPEKEMFGRFSLDSLSTTGDTLEAVVSNEVFQFIIRFPGGVGTCQVAETAREAERLACLAEDYEVYMRGNTFFKLRGCPLEDQRGRKGDIHYLIAAPNYVVDILANTTPSVQLSQTKRA
jgi:hypothetical protein